jgi:hypothetical protein
MAQRESEDLLLYNPGYRSPQSSRPIRYPLTSVFNAQNRREVRVFKESFKLRALGCHWNFSDAHFMIYLRSIIEA